MSKDVTTDLINEVKEIKQLDRAKAESQFATTILGRQPDQAYVEKKKKYVEQHLKISYIESMLDTVFPSWSFVGVDRGVIGNSVYYEGLLTVTHPITGVEIKRSGIGAVPIEVTKGANPMDFERINPKALHKNIPAARSYALKNAAQSLGDLFGRNLNRSGAAPQVVDITGSKAVTGISQELTSSVI